MRAAVSMLMVASSLSAEEGLPDFALCMDQGVARYERELTRWKRGPWAGKFEIGDTRDVEYCGTIAIVLCDRTDAPLPCQRDLAGKQDVMTGQVLATLPLPDVVRGRAGTWSDDLYPQVYALAHGSSAGPDCTGSTEVMETWCEAREANRRLQNAALAWQLARFLDAAPTAVTAGWAQTPPPLRPRTRPEDAL